MKRGFWCVELHMRCRDARLAGLCKQRRTRTVEFTRQLWPQPPKDARPWWCYLHTLKFYDKDMNEIWSQEVPEGHHLHNERMGLRITNVHVEWDDAWGWLLKFEASHDTAMSVWAHLFEHILVERAEGVVAA